MNKPFDPNPVIVGVNSLSHICLKIGDRYTPSPLIAENIIRYFASEPAADGITYDCVLNDTTHHRFTIRRDGTTCSAE